MIKEVPSANYLGATIDLGLTWSDHFTRVVAKANSVLGSVLNSWYMHHSELISKGFSLGCIVWGY